MSDKYLECRDLAIAALLEGKSYREAAKAAGIEPKTLWQWRKLEDFQREYSTARMRVINDTLSKIGKLTDKAIRLIERHIDSQGAEKPLSAPDLSGAKLVLELTLKRTTDEALSLVPALIAERDRLQEENDTLKQRTQLRIAK